MSKNHNQKTQKHNNTSIKMATNKNNSPKFEIVLQKRNFNGELTGQKIIYNTNNTTELSGWFDRNYTENQQTKTNSPPNPESSVKHTNSVSSEEKEASASVV